MEQYDVERFHWEAKVLKIYRGTQEIARLTIAGENLGRT